LYSNATAKKDKDKQIVVMFQVGTRCTFVRRRVPFWNMTTQIDTDQSRYILHAREPFASAPTFSRHATSDATLFKQTREYGDVELDPLVMEIS